MSYSCAACTVLHLTPIQCYYNLYLYNSCSARNSISIFLLVILAQEIPRTARSAVCVARVCAHRRRRPEATGRAGAGTVYVGLTRAVVRGARDRRWA